MGVAARRNHGQRAGRRRSRVGRQCRLAGGEPPARADHRPAHGAARRANPDPARDVRPREPQRGDRGQRAGAVVAAHLCAAQLRVRRALPRAARTAARASGRRRERAALSPVFRAPSAADADFRRRDAGHHGRERRRGSPVRLSGGRAVPARHGVAVRAGRHAGVPARSAASAHVRHGQRLGRHLPAPAQRWPRDVRRSVVSLSDVHEARRLLHHRDRRDRAQERRAGAAAAQPRARRDRQRRADHAHRSGRGDRRICESRVRDHHRLHQRASRRPRPCRPRACRAAGAAVRADGPGAGRRQRGRTAAAQPAGRRLGVLGAAVRRAGARRSDVSHLRDQRPDRADRFARSAGEAGAARCADRFAEPRDAARADRAGGGGAARVRAAVHGRGPAQGHQRQPRPRRGRPPAARGRATAVRLRRRRRHGDALRRRRVRRDARAPGRRRPAGRAAAAHRPCVGASGADRRRPVARAVEHRCRVLPGRRARCGDASEARRSGDVPGEGARPQHRRAVPAVVRGSGGAAYRAVRTGCAPRWSTMASSLRTSRRSTCARAA